VSVFEHSALIPGIGQLMRLGDFGGVWHRFTIP
jgi:hypothetical protein